MSISLESAYSLNGSVISAKNLNNIFSLGFSVLGLVDTRTSFFYTFYKECKANNVKPLLGLRLKGEVYDYIIYAKNEEGYKELLKFDPAKKDYLFSELPISNNFVYVFDLTMSSHHHFPTLEKEFEILFREGLDVFTGFDMTYYPAEVDIAPYLKERFSPVFLNHVTYTNETEHKASKVLKSVYNLEDLSNDSVSYGMILSPDKYESVLKGYEYMLSNTNSLISKIDINLSFIRQFPKFDTPNNLTSEKYLAALSYALIKLRLKGKTYEEQLQYKERLDYELSVIHKMGFDDYFLIVYDYVKFAKQQGIIVGPGRGSASSSLVSYALGIVEVDPLEHELIFERFLNVDRKSYPDIDCDFEDSRKIEVIEYVCKKYGKDNVCQIGTFQTFQIKSAIKDSAKALNIDDVKTKTLTKLIDKEESIDELIKRPEVKNYIIKDEELRELVSVCRVLEGLPRQTGIHASGVIISAQSLFEYTQLEENENGIYVSLYDAPILEEIGLLKMDFLSLKHLSLIGDTIKDIEKETGNKINYYKIPTNDKKTFELLQKRETTGLFQIDGAGISDLLFKMHVEKFSDIPLCLGLYRPGPKDQIPLFLKRREGHSRIEYYDSCLEPILKETLGIVIYQEQIMKICNIYAGLPMSKCDSFRRAMAKKDDQLMASLEKEFYDGAEALNRPLLVTEKIFSDIFKFKDYGFVKAHAVAYSMITYAQAYLKANYPKIFMANLLKSDASPKKYIKDCAKNSITVKAPDIRYSSFEYRVVDECIYSPFTIIKGIGKEYAKIIEEVSKKSSTYESFIKESKGNLPKSLIESLILSGCLDSYGYNKKEMIDSLPGLYDFNTSLIEGFEFRVNKEDDYDFEYLKDKEFEYLGYNFKYNPILKVTSLPHISSITQSRSNTEYICYLQDIREKKTKNGDYMMIAQGSDENIDIKCIAFSKEYLSFAHLLKGEGLYVIEGYKDPKSDEDTVIINNLKKYEC